MFSDLFYHVVILNDLDATTMSMQTVVLSDGFTKWQKFENTTTRRVKP